MHDSQLEDRLRTVLRQEGDRLPLNVDVERLEAELAVRQRAQRSGRFGLLAAGIGIVAFGLVAAGLNGWFAADRIGATPEPSVTPTIGPASPSPVPSPLIGLPPIEPRDGAHIVLDVPPTWTTTATEHSLVTGMSRTQVSWISIACHGREPAGDIAPDTIAVTVRDETHEATCLSEQLFSLNLRPGEEQAVHIAVPEAVAYTVLIEATPLPAELPPLAELEDPAELEASTARVRPNWNAAAGLVETTVGTLDEGLAQDMALVCIGPGQMKVELRSPGAGSGEGPWSGGSIDCIGEPENISLAIGLEGPQEVVVLADRRTAWHLAAVSSGTLQ